MAEIIIFIFSGVFIGIAAGLFGLGGGLMIVPVVTYCLVYFSNTPFDQAIIIGVSTSLASMVITGAMAAYAHSKNNNVDHAIIKRFIPGLIIGSLTIGFFIKSVPLIGYSPAPSRQSLHKRIESINPPVHLAIPQSAILNWHCCQQPPHSWN